MKKASKAILLSLALMLSAPAAFAYESMVGPTGLVRSTPEKAYTGYTLITPTLSTTSYLVDMDGNAVHKWESQYMAGLYAELLPNGHLLRTAQMPNRPVNIGGAGGRIEEFDWDGKLVWSYDLVGPDHVQHHTVDRLPNGNTMILAWERVTSEQMKAKGRNINFPPAEGFNLRGINTKDFWVDFIREVNVKGETVWEWHALDHVGSGPDQLNINYVLPSNVAKGDGYDTVDWSHFNTVQGVPGKDIVVTNSRNLAETYIIDKKTGKITYRWGNPTTQGQGKKPSYYDDGDQKMFGSHCAFMLPTGNLIIFDNGSERPERRRSRVLELDPATNTVVWEYESRISSSFYSDRQGAVQKLPNGNYLVTSTNQGHIFEVTAAKEVVWEYINPIFANLPPTGKYHLSAVFNDDSAALSRADMASNFVHRAFRYGTDFAAFKGKDMSKKNLFGEMPSWQGYAKKVAEPANK